MKRRKDLTDSNPNRHRQVKMFPNNITQGFCLSSPMNSDDNSDLNHPVSSV